MSRAFVSESDSDFQDEDLPALKIPLPPGTRNYMTPEGAEKLKSELFHLTHTERPKIAALLSRQVSGVDSADHQTIGLSRHRLREVERRIEYLNVMVGRLEVVDTSEQDLEQAMFGAVVKVAEENGTTKVYRIVGVDESEPQSGRISWISPLARALIGCRTGEVVKVKLPEQEATLKILEIAYP
ncbi:MAG: GreA/GreB family elongation factor [Spirochaetaceae bacterium]|nr:MAG: GreA/GreB family elongation factor [Spirochaetaceae bacterium]